MGVYIKGMEMPGLIHGPITIRIYPTGKCININSLWPRDPIPGVKAIPVPPHGRLIDADVVARDLQEMSEDIEKSFPYLDKNDALMIERGIQFARQYVLNLAPAIIPADQAEEGEEHVD